MSTGRSRGVALFAALFALCLALPPGIAAHASTEVSTDVELAVTSSFALVRVAPDGVDPDYAGTLAGVRDRVLEARAEGAAGDVSGTWTRSVDGVADTKFSAVGLTHPLANDALEGGRSYRYKLTAVDQAGTARSVDFAVDVRYLSSDRVAHAPGSDERVDVAGDAYNDGVREASVYVRELEGAAPGDALRILSQAAALRGKSVDAAWSVGMTVPQGVDAPPFVGSLTVSFPYPLDSPAFPWSLSAASLAQAGPDVLFLADGSDQPVLLSTVYANRRASFEAPALGAFVVLSGGPVITHDIKASASAGGSIDPEGTVVVRDGESALFVFHPDAGYAVQDVKVDGASCGALASYKFDGVARNHTIEVSFAPLPPTPALFTLTVSVGEGGAVQYGSRTVEGSEAFRLTQGDPVLLTFMPSVGWRVEDVLVNGVSIGRPATYAIPALAGDVTVEVRFAPGADDPKATHVVTAEAGEGGAVSPERAEVAHGGDATFSFVPDKGYRVSQVLVDGVAVEAAGYLTLRNVVADHRIQVSFERAEGFEAASTYVVSATAGPHGIISPAGDVEVTAGTDAPFSFIPESGYRISRVTVDGVALAYAPRSWTFSNVQANHTVHVEFEPVAALAQTGEGRAPVVGLVAIVLAVAALAGARFVRRLP